MNKQETIDLLTTDIKAFNKYREDNPDWIPDISGVDMWDVNLRGANLRGINLISVSADLTGADITDAYTYDGPDYEYHMYKGSTGRVMEYSLEGGWKCIRA